MNSNSTHDNNDETKTTKATYDPGWNDPPLFSFDTVNTTLQSKSAKKTLLNKRVAFPMTSQQSSTKSPTTLTSMPPTTNSSIAPAASPSSGHANKTELSGSTDCMDKEEALHKVLHIFDEVLMGASEKLKKNDVEIRRRLDIMKKMWEEDKLKPEIHVKMVQLSEALSSGNGEHADHIHMSLMVDHVSLCSPWMVGVRQLIHHVKSQSTIPEQEQSSTGIPLIEK